MGKGAAPLGDSFIDVQAFASALVNELYGKVTWDRVKERILTAPARYKRWWLDLVEHSPGHVVAETALILFIIWLVFLRKTEEPGKDEAYLTEKEIDELVKEWKSEPLTPPPDPEWDEDPALVVDEMEGATLTVGKKRLLNLASYDFLGLGGRPEVKAAARAALDKYGCGSCGPRGFYGTIDTHVEAEEAVARFMGAEEAISYSDAASSVSSTLPAFAKKGDLIIADEGVYEPLKTALALSRSQVRYFKHNDMADLERVLRQIAEEDKRRRRSVLEQRRFIAVEGLYKNFGDLCPLQELVALKKRYCYRLYLDQTYSFGTLGATGRGLTEFFGVPLEEVDIMSVSTSHALGTVGGMCVGTTEVVDHQRLSGAGYCFSASAPPFTSSAAVAALQVLEQEPQLVRVLGDNARFMSKGIAKIPGLKVRSDEISPLIHVELDPSLGLDVAAQKRALRTISRKCIDAGYAIVTSKYKIGETFEPPPSLRITVSSIHTQAELKGALDALKSAAASALKK